MKFKFNLGEKEKDSCGWIKSHLKYLSHFYSQTLKLFQVVASNINPIIMLNVRLFLPI